MRRLLSFPDPVNETSARLVAGDVVLQALLFLGLRQGWLFVPLVYGFAARVLAGPTLSPLGQFVTRMITPRLRSEHRYVPGPPKRFAQGIGLTFAGAAAVAWAFSIPALAVALIVVLAAAATLETLFSFCLGCVVYRFFWQCDDCDDISERLRVALAPGRATLGSEN